MNSIILVSILVSATIAYDFKDSFFNEELAEDFKDMSEFVIEGVRAKREIEDNHQIEDQEHCKPRTPLKCCDGSFNKERFHHGRKIKKQCYLELYGNATKYRFDPFDCSQIEEAKEKITCVAQCMGQKFNIVDNKNDISRDALLNRLKSRLQTEWKLEAAESVVDICMEEIKSNEDSTSEAGKCNPQTLKVMYCLWKEFAKACPEDNQISSDKCDRFRERLASDQLPSAYNRFHRRLRQH